ncbi:MAG: TlpA disulfide reductase family protein, partial [Pseudomonadota bacterium]
AVLAAVLIAASQPVDDGAQSPARRAAAAAKTCPLAAAERDVTLLKGDVADFAFAFTNRDAPSTPFFEQSAGGAAERRLADFRGRPVLVNFWATFCQPCLEELPSLDRLQRAVGEDVAVVAVAADPSGPEKARAYFDRLGIKTLTLYTDEKLRLASAVGGVSVMPVTILYDEAGRELGRLRGAADWAGADARRLVEARVSCG